MAQIFPDREIGLDRFSELEMKHYCLFVEELDTFKVEVASLAIDDCYFRAGFLPQTKSIVDYQKRRYSSIKLICFFCYNFTRLRIS